MLRETFAPPGDRIEIETNDAVLFDLAGRFWDPAPSGGSEGREPIRMSLRVTGGPPPPEHPEEHVERTHAEDSFTTRLGEALWAEIDRRGERVRGFVSREALEREPYLAARSLLEEPAAVLLSCRGFTCLHAGAVVGARGAAVVRGPSGAGKSTLVAAAWQAGFGILGDESILVSGKDSVLITASIRDLTLLSDSVKLLGLPGRTTPAFSGGEPKERIDLFSGGRPSDRRAKLAAAVLLGPRTPGPARLVSLSPAEFHGEFGRGAIPEESRGGDPDGVSTAWGKRGGYLLVGASDLAGAIALLQGLCGG